MSFARESAVMSPGAFVSEGGAFSRGASVAHVLARCRERAALADKLTSAKIRIHELESLEETVAE